MMIVARRRPLVMAAESHTPAPVDLMLQNGHFLEILEIHLPWRDKIVEQFSLCTTLCRKTSNSENSSNFPLSPI
jgi:hypothetical protein